MTTAQKLKAFQEKAKSKGFKSSHSESYVQEVTLNYKLNNFLKSYEKHLRDNKGICDSNTLNRLLRVHDLDGIWSTTTRQCVHRVDYLSLD